MTIFDYLLNVVLVGLVVLQMRGRRLDRRGLLLPLGLVAWAASQYLHGIPTVGNDGLLVAIGVGAGLGLGVASARLTRLDIDRERGPSGVDGWLTAHPADDEPMGTAVSAEHPPASAAAPPVRTALRLVWLVGLVYAVAAATHSGGSGRHLTAAVLTGTTALGWATWLTAQHRKSLRLSVAGVGRHPGRQRWRARVIRASGH